MNTVEFLSRVVPREGNYLTVTWPNQNKTFGWPSRSFPAADGHAQAAGLVGWAVRNNIDIYHAIGAFTAAEARTGAKGQGYVVASRTQGNVQAIKVLFIDADVKRDGDNKDPAHCFADRRSALRWMLNFCQATGLPKPNIVIDSGHGFHWYWVLEQHLTVANWLPLANALKQAALAHNFTGDIAIVTDAARILRPPGSVNMKSGTPVAVRAISQAADIPNTKIASALAPWIGVAQATGTHGASARGPATVTQLGPRPAHIAPGATPLNDAASAGVEHRDYKFVQVAAKCEQVKRSLAAGGAGDSYHVWTAHHTLAGFCTDGAEHIHPISEKDPRYDQAANEAKFAKTLDEIAKKGIGAPRCSTYDGYRPGVCPNCPWFGKLNSPITLGVEDGDLPHRYRRRSVMGETRVEWCNADDEWVHVMTGDVYAPRLDWLPSGGYLLSFMHAMGGKVSAVACRGGEMGHPLTVMGIVERQGISADRHNAGRVGDFVVAWINQLRTQRVERAITLRPFGWNFNQKGERLGLAVAGTHYRRDGGEEMIPGGDQKVRALYQPMGNLSEWRRAAALFEGAGKRADLQGLIACSFGSPLISLCGDVRGMSLNWWSTESGVGKTSAMRLGQSVWGDWTAMQSMSDTPNAVMKSLSEPRVLVRYWDELRVRRSWHDGWVEMIYVVPQGKERARMQADTTLREVGEWQALLVFTSNRPYSDILVAGTAGTDSGLYRLLEIRMRKTAQAFQPGAGPVLSLTDTNYGHAGRIYAKYLAQHAPEVEQRLAQMIRKFSVKVNATQEERFYVTAIACILVGAMIAKQLGLFDFDVPGIYAVMENALQEARKSVTTRTVVSSKGGYDIEQLIAEYYYETADVRIRTKSFAKRGQARVEVVAQPRGESVRVHYSENGPVLRAAREHLNGWLNLRNLPSSQVIEQLVHDYGAIEQRAVLAGGTRWAGAKTICVDIPLTATMIGQPDPAGDPSDDDEDEDDDEVPARASVRPAAVAGNQVKL